MLRAKTTSQLRGENGKIRQGSLTERQMREVTLGSAMAAGGKPSEGQVEGKHAPACTIQEHFDRVVATSKAEDYASSRLLHAPAPAPNHSLRET